MPGAASRRASSRSHPFCSRILLLCLAAAFVNSNINGFVLRSEYCFLNRSLIVLICDLQPFHSLPSKVGVACLGVVYYGFVCHFVVKLCFMVVHILC